MQGGLSNLTRRATSLRLQRGIISSTKQSNNITPQQQQACNITTIIRHQNAALKLLGMKTTPYQQTSLLSQSVHIVEVSRVITQFKSFFTTKHPHGMIKQQIPKQKNISTTTSSPSTKSPLLHTKRTKSSLSSTKSNPTLLTTNNSTFKSILTNGSRRHALRAITVGASADELGKIRQTPRDWSINSADLQKYHDELVKKKLPFNGKIDVEFLLKPETSWTADSLLGLIIEVIKAPWDAMMYMYDLCRKVYLRFSKKFDRSLLPWVYQILDLKVPLEDLVFDINNFSPEEHQLYILLTSILRYQLVLELALSNAIAQAPFPTRFVQQLEDNAQKAGLTEEEFQKQVVASRQQFQKQKQLALQQLRLVAIPADFYPDDEVVEMIQTIGIPRDLPIEEIIAQPQLAIDYIRGHVLDQVAQIPMQQMPTLLEFKGLAGAVRHLDQPQHYANYKALLQLTTQPDHALRRQIRQLALQGTSKDYDGALQTVMKQLQHMRRIIKTYQRQQTQLKNFGFIAKRRPDFSQAKLRKLSKADQAMFMQDMEEGMFLTIDDVDPEEAAEGSLIEEELRVPERYKTKKQNARNNDAVNKRRDKRNARLAANAPPLTEQDMKLTLRLMAVIQEAQEEGNGDIDLDDEALSDDSNDQELLSDALDQYNGDVKALERYLRPVYLDLKNSMTGNDNDDGDDYYDEDDDYDDDMDLDPLHDDDYDDETYLNENLVPMRNRNEETEEERIRRDNAEEERDRRRSERQDRYSKDIQNARDNKKNKNKKDKTERFLQLPPHVMRDSNPKIVSDQWYRDAMENYGKYQNRLARVQRMIMMRDFNTRAKYLTATHHFAQAILSEKDQREAATALQKELGKKIAIMFETLPDDLKYVFFERRQEVHDARKQGEERRKQRLEEQKRAKENKEPLKKVTSATDLEKVVKSASTDVADMVLPDHSAINVDLHNNDPVSVTSTNNTISDHAPFATELVDNVVQTPDGSVVLGSGVEIKDDAPITLGAILSANNEEEKKSTPPPPPAPTPQPIPERKERTQHDVLLPPTTPADPNAPKPELVKKPGVQYEFPKPKDLQEEFEQWSEMLAAIQEYQLVTHQNMYLIEQLQASRDRAQNKVMSENIDLITRIQKLEEEQGPLTQEELDSNPDLQLLQERMESVQIRPTRVMQRNATERAMQHTELPLAEQMQLVRMKGLTNVELFNSEMYDVIYSSMRDLLQTSLYDSGNHQIVEQSVCNLVLSVLNAPKRVESYDAMARFNQNIEEELNRQRFTVGKLSTMDRKFILMQLQQEHNINKVLPLGELPATLSFLGDIRKNSDDFVKHEQKFNNEDGSDSYPFSNYALTQLIQQPMNHSEFTAALKKSIDSGVPIDQLNIVPLYKTELQLTERSSDHTLSEQPDKIIVSPQQLNMDLFDARFDILAPKHLFKQLTKVRDRRLRELLQLIALVGADQQTLASTTKFHIKTLEPALTATRIPEHLVVYMTKFYTHRTIAATLNAIIKELSSKRKAVVDRALDFSREEYDVTLQYCMDLLQYHNLQLQAKAPDLFNAQFKAMDIQRAGGFAKYNKIWNPHHTHPLSIKELIEVSDTNNI